jgi:hypothetical protein
MPSSRHSDNRAESALPSDERVPHPPDGAGERPCKLDLQYFTDPERCPLMVRRGARRAFELFLFLAHRTMQSGGRAVRPSHKALCGACGLDPLAPASKPAMSRLLRLLRDDFGVIDYQPVRNRRPEILLRPAASHADPWNPPHYVYFQDGWGPNDQQAFAALHRRAFAAEFMYFVSQFEAALAWRKHDRRYWFFPLERIATTFHVSTQFAAVGLRALVDLGVMRVRYGQYQPQAAGEDVARANRYYFVGLAELSHCSEGLEKLKAEYAAEHPLACRLAAELANGRTVKNVRGLCELIAHYGATAVHDAVAMVAKYQRRNPRRRLAYVSALLRATGPS